MITALLIALYLAAGLPFMLSIYRDKQGRSLRKKIAMHIGWLPLLIFALLIVRGSGFKL